MKGRLGFGVAYYDEYMPVERLTEDIRMMKEAGINVVRIAESTWSTLEPVNGVFDFTSIDRVLNAMNEAGISVIIGTPTYAIPPWIYKEHPDVLAETADGKEKYGRRQNMDITHPAYLFYAERMIRKLLSHVKDHPAIMGYQVDNETKAYGTAGPNVHVNFVRYLREKFGTVQEMNRVFGFAYWSNQVDSWESCPSPIGTINASYACEFKRFQRKLVTDFLSWQVEIIKEYKSPKQFVTQNFDFAWKDHSYGVQPDVDHFEAAKPFNIAGVDIYHPTEDKLTGVEISFGGDIARSLKKSNYLVMETQAQGLTGWLPYPGQLRLQAFSHLASGANMVSYWHWHSIHNSQETYWKGLLSHDFRPTRTYEEAKSIGRDFVRVGGKLVNLKKNNKAAILISNTALSAFDSFPEHTKTTYNDLFRLYYDALYRLNIGCDILSPESDNFSDYSMIVVPGLAAASDDLLMRLGEYTKMGGNCVFSIKTGFADENVQVRTAVQPGLLEGICGMWYNEFTHVEDITVENGKVRGKANGLIELLQSASADVLLGYEHPYWKEYAAVTLNSYGSGLAMYIGCIPDMSIMEILFKNFANRAGLSLPEREYAFPIIVKTGINAQGKEIRYIFNYSEDPKTITSAWDDSLNLIADEVVLKGGSIKLPPWGFAILEGD